MFFYLIFATWLASTHSTNTNFIKFFVNYLILKRFLKLTKLGKYVNNTNNDLVKQKKIVKAKTKV